MEELLLVAIGSFLAAALTVPAGFGLSTILTPLVLPVSYTHLRAHETEADRGFRGGG